MQKFIRILMLLAVTMLAGSNVWAQDDPGNGEGNPLGVIYYDDQDATVTTAGGVLEFYNNEACVDDYNEGLHQLWADENVPQEWLDADRLVYIKATPNAGYRLGATDAETGTVTFISVTVWEAMTPSGARQMTRGDGDEDETAIPVYAVDGQRGVYMFQMPADGSNVLVEAQFPLKAKLGDPGYDHIQFIDYEADPTTGEMTAVTRSTEELGVPVYVLDGTETMLGTPVEVEDEDNITEDDFTEAWYVCLATANGGNDLEYIALSGKECALELADYCKIHLILTDGCQMAVYGPETGQDGLLGNVGASLTIYGQGGTDASNQSTEGVLLAECDGDAIFLSGDLTINGGQICFRSENGTAISNNQSAIAIRGGTVQLEGASGISSERNVTISGGEVNAIGASDAIFTSSDGVTISGGIVNAIGGDRGIALDEGVLTISGGEVNVGGEVNASDENDMSYGIYSASTPTENGSTIVISDGTVNAFGATAIFAAGDLDISGGTVTAIGDDGDNDDDGDGEFGIESGGSITISGGMVTASGGEVAIDSEENLTISGGTVNANSSNNFAVYSVGKLTISDDPDDAVDAVVEAQGKQNAIFAVGDVEISGGTVKASSDAEAIYSSGNVTISGGTVEASAIFALNDITLGWTATDDYIMAGSYETATGAVTTAAGCRFVALGESAGEGLPTAMAMVPGGAQAHTTAAAGDGFAVSDIAGRTLRPVDGYLLGLCPGLGVAQSNPSAQALEFTMAGDETTHYYIYKKDDQLLLSVGGVEDGFNGTVYEVDTPVEILQEDPTDPTAMPTRYEGFKEYDHTIDMPAEDLKIVAYRAIEHKVDYLSLNSDDNKYDLGSSNVKTYILDGHDHTLYGGNNAKDDIVWYVLKAKANDTSGWMNDGDGNWMLTADGNMFECRGDVNIILADGSALCVGTSTHPLLSDKIVFEADGDLNFYTQSVPDTRPSATNDEMITTDNRGRMEFYTDGATVIHSSGGSITLTNVVMSVAHAGGRCAIAAYNNVNIIGGQFNDIVINAGQDIFLNPIASTDEFHATGFSSTSGMVEIAPGKSLTDRVTFATALSGSVAVSDIAGKNLVGLENVDATGGSSGGGSTKGANYVAVANTGGSKKIVNKNGGTKVESAILTELKRNGEFHVQSMKNLASALPFDCSDIIPGAVAVSADPEAGNGDVQPTVVLLATEGTLSNDASSVGSAGEGEQLPPSIPVAGVGASEDLLNEGSVAGQITSEQGLRTIVAGNGKLKEGELAKKGIHDENEKQSGGGGSISIGHGKEDSGIQSLAIGYGHQVTGNHSGAYGDARKRAPKEDRLVMTLIPVDYDPDKVLPEGEIRLFVTNNQLLSIAIYQREHPDEVAQARARGALMIDTTTPETTAIIGRLMVTERAQPVDGHWYGLDGRRLPSAPTAKGIYVHRGRKVVIR